ncbi:MAG: transcription antitermination factor NusB [Actinomycetes bacterium]
MAARSKARKRALDVLYESDIRSGDAREILVSRTEQADPPVGEYAAVLVEGVLANRSRIDEVIETYAQGWEIGRMPAVDRNILRIALFEILFQSEIDTAVAIDEAVELAKALSTDDSPSYINGLLGRVAPMARSLTGE